MGKFIVSAIGLGIGIWQKQAGLGLSAGLLLGSLLFPEKTTVEHNKASNLKATESTYGQHIPTVKGQHRVQGDIIWIAKDENGNAIRETLTVINSKGTATVNKYYQYYASFAVMLCEGEIAGITKIVAEDTVIYDITKEVPTKYDITVYNGDYSQEPSPVIEAWEGLNNTPAYRGRAYVVFNDLELEQWGNRIPSMFFHVQTQTSTLGEVIEERLIASGLESSEIDVTDLNSINVTGFMQNERASLSSYLPHTLEFYQVDLIEVDGKIKGVRRGGASVVNIPEEDFGASHDYTAKERYTTAREQDRELPQILNLSYVDIENGYMPAIEQAIRQTQDYVKNTVGMTVPLALNRNEAVQAVHRILYSKWAARTTYDFSLPIKYIYLTPADIITIPIGDRRVRVRIQEINIELMGKLDVKAVADNYVATTQTITGGTSGSQSSGSVDIADQIDTEFDLYSGIEFKDSHALRAGFYVIATGRKGWRGCTIYYSPNATDWIQGAIINQRGSFGTTWNALPSGGGQDVYDNSSILDVNIKNQGALTSQSEVLVDNGLNACLIGNEIAGFKTATSYTSNDYHVSGIKRGRRSTSIVGKPAGSRFWVVDSAVKRVPVNDGLIGTNVLVKCVSFGGSFAAAPTKTVFIQQPTYPLSTQADLDWVAQTVIANTNYTVPNFPKKTYCIVAKGNNTITLPAVADWKRPIFIKAEGASVNVVRSGSALINGASSLAMTDTVSLSQPIITQGYGGVNSENTLRRQIQILSNSVDWVIVHETFAG